MAIDISFEFDEEEYEKLSHEQQCKVIDTLIGISALNNLDRLFWLTPTTNSDKAIIENLKDMGMHAGEKRIGMGEYRLPSSFMALLQYDFMLTIMKEQTITTEIQLAINYGLRVLKNFKDFFDMPSFEREDDILVVEVYEKNNDNGYVEDFKKINNIDVSKYDIRRCLPNSPNSIGTKITKQMGFINTCGNVSKSSKRLMEIFKHNTTQKMEEKI